MSTPLRIALGVLLAMHGVAHLPGFLVAWELRTFPTLPYSTTVLGGTLDVGSMGIRFVGALWLVAAVACIAGSSLVLARSVWAPYVVAAVLVTSTLVCVLGWPAARVGLLANAAVAILFVVTLRLTGATSAAPPP